MPLDIGIPELVLIFVVVLMVFGPGKLPELARGLGVFIRDLRNAARELTRDITAELEEPGGKSNASRSQVVCPHCSALNPTGHPYCGQCGGRLA